jgi:hypothetical protein
MSRAGGMTENAVCLNEAGEQLFPTVVVTPQADGKNKRDIVWKNAAGVLCEKPVVLKINSVEDATQFIQMYHAVKDREQKGYTKYTNDHGLVSRDASLSFSADGYLRTILQLINGAYSLMASGKPEEVAAMQKGLEIVLQYNAVAGEQIKRNQRIATLRGLLTGPDAEYAKSQLREIGVNPDTLTQPVAAVEPKIEAPVDAPVDGAVSQVAPPAENVEQPQHDDKYVPRSGKRSKKHEDATA